MYNIALNVKRGIIQGYIYIPSGNYSKIDSSFSVYTSDYNIDLIQCGITKLSDVVK